MKKWHVRTNISRACPSSSAAGGHAPRLVQACRHLPIRLLRTNRQSKLNSHIQGQALTEAHPLRDNLCHSLCAFLDSFVLHVKVMCNVAAITDIAWTDDRGYCPRLLLALLCLLAPTQDKVGCDNPHRGLHTPALSDCIQYKTNKRSTSKCHILGRSHTEWRRVFSYGDYLSFIFQSHGPVGTNIFRRLMHGHNGMME